MRTSFDKFGNYEVPQITLCNPSAKATIDDNGRVKLSNAIGILTDPKGTHLKLNFNAPHEVSFDYERHISENPIKQSFYDNIYNGIETERYVFTEGVGFYVIKGLTDSDEDGVDKKSATCRSCEVEHENFEGINIEADTAYVLHNAEKTGLLDLYIAGCPNWTIKYIDPVLLYKNGVDGEARVFTFDKIDTEDGYKFLWETIQDGCECIVEPNILTRELSFYSRELYAQEHKTDILIAYFNLLKYRTIEEGDEDKWTALNVLGKDEDLRISMVNPTGMNTLYNFTYRYAWMSPELQEALDKWQAKINSVEDEYYELVSGYAPQRDSLWNKAEDIKVLETELEVLNSSRDAIISSTEDAEVKDKDGNVIKAAGQTKDEALGQINVLISAKQTEISTTKSEYSTLETQIEEEYEDSISDINSACRLGLTATDIDGNYIFAIEEDDKLVSNGLLEELAPHIKATDYNDEYLGITENMTWVQKYEIAKQLYDRAKSQMVKLSSGKKTVKIDTASFLFNERFKRFSDQLVAGAIINAEITKDTIEEWHLTGIDIDFDERKTDFTLGNKYDRSDLKSLYEDTLGSHSKTASDLKYLKSIIEEQEKINHDMSTWLERSRTLTLDNILKSHNHSVIINDRGYWGREWLYNQNNDPDLPIYSPEQLKMINNGLYITRTNWTPTENDSGLAVALGKIYLDENSDDYVYGLNADVIMGKLFLGNNLILTGKAAGIKILNNNNQTVFYANDNGELVLTGTIYANAGKIGGWDIMQTIIGNTLIPGVIDIHSVGIAPGINTTDLSISQSFTGGGKSGLCFWAGAIWNASSTDYNKVDISSAPFRVYNDGSLYTNKGNIGGWILEEGKLYASYNSNGTKYCGIGIQGVSWAFYSGATTSEGGDGIFRVGHDGALYATNANISGGKIGNWNISNNRLENYQNDKWHIYFQVPTELGNSLEGSHSPRTIMQVRNIFTNSYPFLLMSDGTVYATKMVISGDSTFHGSGSFTGTVTAESGVLKNGVYFGTNKYSKINSQLIGTEQYTYWQSSNEGACIILAQEYGSNLGYVQLYGSAGIVMNVSPWINDTVPISSSDVNKKNNISKISDAYELIFDKLVPVTYKYNNGTSNRLHTGLEAQKVVSAIEDAGLTTKDFAAVCYNKKSNEWGLRYGEFISLNIWQIQKAKVRISELENRVTELEKLLKV